MIVWDGERFAADKRCIYGGYAHTVTKIWKVFDPTFKGNVLVGGSGETAFIKDVLRWIERGRVHEDMPPAQRDKDDWQPIVVIERLAADELSEQLGTVRYRTLFYERSPCPIEYESKTVTLGSGRDYARAFLHMGKNAVEAVKLTCELDTGCGNGIDVLTLDEADAPLAT